MVYIFSFSWGLSILFLWFIYILFLSDLDSTLVYFCVIFIRFSQIKFLNDFIICLFCFYLFCFFNNYHGMNI